MERPVKIGISSCLCGEKVRYDGGDNHDRRLTTTLGKYFTLVPVCPEVESGLPTPRERMRLEGNRGNPRLVTVDTNLDLTDWLKSFSKDKAAELERENICGFVFKVNSPTSGLRGVRIYSDDSPPKEGRGLFAAEVVKRFPHMPVEDERALADPIVRENFIQRVFTYSRWKGTR
jgi:uncharacterized protein YbbK (DUF523 family)